MAEAAGLVVGVIGLIGTFKSCIDLFSYFSSSRSLGRDYEILDAKLHVEKALLLQWAHRVRLLESEYDQRLDDSTTLSAVTRILASIQHLLSESSSLQERYGLQQTGRAMNETRVATISKLRIQKFTQEFDALHIRMSQKQQGVSTSAKLRWIITDKDKFDRLIQELSHFVSRLNQLFPITEQRHDKNIFKDMASEDLSGIRDVKAMRVIRDATIGRQDLLAEAAEERLLQVCQQSVLDLIWFRSMDDRKDGVAPPYSKTLEWALKPPHTEVEWDDLSKWFRSESGIYWLSGKAGSGKSTLMKYLYNHEDTTILLNQWAGSSQLTVGSFFFWNLGTTEQRSQDGLSRAILYQVLHAEPSLIPVLLPRLWQETLRGYQGELDPPFRGELLTAFETLTSNSQLQRHFCFFIDGLDECVGNYLDGIMFVKELCRNPQIKVLVSSRPIPLCVDSFSCMPKLQLEDLSRNDISNYVHDIVGSHPYMASLLASDPVNSNVILQELINKAAGVFLWVVLACRSVLAGFAAHDSIQELCHRVDDLPPELEELFRHMLDKVESRYHEQMAKMLKICYQRQVNRGHQDKETSIYTIALALLDNCGFDCENSDPLRSLSMSKQRGVCAPMEGRLRSRCGGLLEVRRRKVARTTACFCTSKTHDDLVHSTVEFMHRTVFEFLDSPQTWSLACLRIADAGFNANAALSIMGVQLARLILPGANKSSLQPFIMDAINCGQLADNESPDSGFAILPKLEEIAGLLPETSSRPDQSQMPRPKTQFRQDNIPLLLAVESGMVNCTRYYLSRVGAASLQFPLLYHAIRKPLFWRAYNVPSSQDVIRYLLSQECRPNEVFKNFEELTTTPWRDWLRELHRMDSNRFFATTAVTEEFIIGGADLNPTALEPVDAIIQRHLDNTKTFSIEGRERVRKGTKLLNLIGDRKEEIGNEPVIQDCHQVCTSTCSHNARSPIREESRKRRLANDDYSLEVGAKIAKRR